MLIEIQRAIFTLIKCVWFNKGNLLLKLIQLLLSRNFHLKKKGKVRSTLFQSAASQSILKILNSKCTSSEI